MLAAAVVAAVALALPACSHDNVLGPGASICFRALPPAAAAVHHRGELVGVRLTSGRRTGRLFRGAPGVPSVPSVTPPSTRVAAPAATPNRLCLVAYRGGYRAGDVDHLAPASNQAGRYAIIWVSLRTDRVVAAFLVDHLPTRFNHRT